MGAYKIYKITNIINNKIYIGKTTVSINKRLDVHRKNAKKRINRHLYDSMNKYGEDAFVIELIDSAETNELANEKEIFYINEYNSNNRDVGYNMTKGGDGGNTGAYYYGKSPYDWWVEKYGKEEADKIKKRVYGDVSQKLKKYYRGMSWEERFGEKSEDVKEKISDTNVRKGIKPPVQYWTNSNHPMLNKHHSEITRKKLSKHRKDKTYEELFGIESATTLKENCRKNWTGEKNPNYVPDLNKTEQKKIIEYLINNKTIKECSNLIEKSEYKLRQFLRKIGISNIQKFMQN